MSTSHEATCLSPFPGLLSFGAAVSWLCLLTTTGCGGFAAQGKNADGVRLFSQARYQDAIQEFDQAINNDPRDPDGYYNLAATYHRMGTVNGNPNDLKQAEQYYRMCQDRDPDHVQSYRGLAVLMVQEGRSEEAFRLIENWADRQPALAEPKIELARLYQEFGDLDAAKAHLNEAIHADPRNARALAALGNLREQMGETAAALKDYEQSLSHDRFQADVAARASALRAALLPAQSPTTATGEMQIATGVGPQIR